jgi:hypothetical protein
MRNRGLLYRLSMLALLLLGCKTAPPPPPVSKVPSGLEEIIRARDNDRVHVQEIKEKFKPVDREYQQARRLYGEAYARYDAWTNLLSVAIVLGTEKDLRTDKRYEDIAQAAGRADREFADYVESVTGSSKGVSSFASSIVEAGIKIWLAWREAAIKERKEVADYVGGHLKWETWESIKTEIESSVPKREARP